MIIKGNNRIHAVRTLWVLVLLVLYSLLAEKIAFASIGVGIGPGKIIIKDKLVSGLEYTIPSVTVLNTGDESEEFGVRVAYPGKQKEQKPPAEWFEFSPKKIKLKPNESQMVEVSLRIPRAAKPGKYFVYIEAYPVIRGKGGAMVGVAAATKVYFTVKSGSLVFFLYHSLKSFLARTAPGSYLAIVLTGAIALIAIFRKFFSVSFSIRKD